MAFNGNFCKKSEHDISTNWHHQQIRVGSLDILGKPLTRLKKHYDMEEPFAEKRPLDDKKFTIDHLYAKLFKLSEKMNTETANEEATARTNFMKGFVSQLSKEIDYE